ncbi:MAG: hypothetical protein IJX72_02780 [Clostridia bacterium]|nr:hypothetical protein [Clostridia bacterium]
MKPILIAQKMTEIDERFILGSMPPAPGTALPKPRRESAFARFASSGWGAAVISGVVALGVLVAIVVAGRTPPDLPPVTTDDPPPVSESTEGERETVTEPETEEVTEPETEDESETEAETAPEVVMTPEELKAAVYELLDDFDLQDYCSEYYCGPFYPIHPSEYWEGSDKAYAYVTTYGRESVPYILEYVIYEDSEIWTNGYYESALNDIESRGFLMAAVYEMLGVTEWYFDAWIHPTNDFNYCADLAAIPLLEFINRYGMDAVREWADVCVTLNAMEWSDEDYAQITKNKLNSPASSLLKDKYEAIAAHGEESVPFILRYILQMGQPLPTSNHVDSTRKQEKRMAFYLACAYEMSGVTSANQWKGVDGKVSLSQYRAYTQTFLDGVEPPLNYTGMRKEVYDLLEGFNASDYFDAILYDGERMTFPTADTPGFAEACAALSVYGVESIPYMMEYLSVDHLEVYYTSYPDQWETFDRYVILAAAYRMLGVTGDPAASWIFPPQGNPYPQRGATFLLEFLNRYGADAIQRRAEVYELLDTLWLNKNQVDALFPTTLSLPVSQHYPKQYEALSALGEDAAPFILQYVAEDAHYMNDSKPYDMVENASKTLFIRCVWEMLGMDPTVNNIPSAMYLLDCLADGDIESLRPAEK